MIHPIIRIRKVPANEVKTIIKIVIVLPLVLSEDLSNISKFNYDSCSVTNLKRRRLNLNQL